jgi:hypothetical protein
MKYRGIDSILRLIIAEEMLFYKTYFQGWQLKMITASIKAVKSCAVLPGLTEGLRGMALMSLPLFSWPV